MNIKLKDGTSLTLNLLLENILSDISFYKLIENPSESLTIEILKVNSFVLSLIEDQTEEMCLTAVRSNYILLQYVKNKNLLVCLEAAKSFKSQMMEYNNKFETSMFFINIKELITTINYSDIDDCIEKLENKIKLSNLIEDTY